MRHKKLNECWRGLLLVAAVVIATGCGVIEIPIDLELEEGSSITMQIPILPPGSDTVSTTLVGGVQTTMAVDLNPFKLFTLSGILASVGVDDVLIAGESFAILGIPTGTLCLWLNDENPGGGTAHVRPIQGEVDFYMALNTLVSVTNPFLLGFLGDPLPFDTVVDAQDIPLPLSDLLALFLGTGAGSLSITQDVSTTLPDDIPLMGGSQVSATLTLTNVDAIAPNPLTDECIVFLAGL